MSARLTCPSCHVSLTVSDRAPARLTCPRCLAPIQNPVPPALPMRVIPVEEETDHDFALSGWTIVLILVFAGIGITAFATQSHFGGLALSVVAGMLIVGGYGVFQIARHHGPVPGTRPMINYPSSPEAFSGQSRTLNYQTPPPGAPDARTPVGLQFFLGIVAWVIAVALTIGLINDRDVAGAFQSIGIPQSQSVALLIVGMLIVFGLAAILLQVKFRWRGFVPGMLLGLVLTCLVPVGLVFVICGGMRF